MSDFNNQLQEALLTVMLSDPIGFAQSQNILRPEYFTDSLRPAVRYLLDYAQRYKSLPTVEQVRAESGVSVTKWSEDPSEVRAWYLEKIEAFARHRAAELVIVDGPDLLATGNMGEIQRRIAEAATITLMKDLGTNYFKDPKSRLEAMKDKSNFVPTGWNTLDRLLYGGFTKGSLNIFAGGSGSGKSLWLQNISLNWAFMGLHVIYFTLELDETLTSMRMDAMVTGMGTKELLKDIDNVSLKIKRAGQKTAGSLTLKKLPQAGTTANDLSAYMKEYEIQTGNVPSAMALDYLDLMSPADRSIKMSDLFVKDKYVSEEVRSLAGERDIPCATASQLNRQSVEAEEYDHSHIAGGVSKINTADNVFGLNGRMKDQGRYTLQFLKTRTSGAVGTTVEMAYDPECMRIMDKNEGDEATKAVPNDQIEQKLKEKAEQKEEVPEGKANIAALMGRIKSKSTV